MDSGHADDAHTEVTTSREIRPTTGEEQTCAEHKPTIVEKVKEKVSTVKEKFSAAVHLSAPSTQTAGASSDAHHTPPGYHTHDHQAQTDRSLPDGPYTREHPPVLEHIPSGGIIMTAPPDVEDPHHGLGEKIKNVFKFPVPDSTLTPSEDFESSTGKDPKI